MSKKVLVIAALLLATPAQAGWYSAIGMRCYKDKCYKYNYYININPPPTYHF